MQMSENWGLIGHEWAVNLLRGHLVNKRVRHAYLITGPRGVGRRTLALRMTQGLNCPQPLAPGIPCGACSTCQRIERMQHPDLLPIQAEGEGGMLKVEQIRELQRGLSLTPYEAPHKIALLLHFEKANASAANALLKTLEEPPPKVILFLTALDGEALLPTITSRCELIRLRPLSYNIVAEGLQTQWGIPAGEARLLAHIANGCPGAAIRLHTEEDARKQRRSHLEELQQVLRQNRVQRFHYAEKVAQDRLALKLTLLNWLSLWRDILLQASGSGAQLTNLDEAEFIQQAAHTFGRQVAARAVQHLTRSITLLEQNVNARLTTEALLLQLPHLR